MPDVGISGVQSAVLPFVYQLKHGQLQRVVINISSDILDIGRSIYRSEITLAKQRTMHQSDKRPLQMIAGNNVDDAISPEDL